MLEDSPSHSDSLGSPPVLNEPPPNPEGGKTLIVDHADAACYPRPSAALKDAGPDDQIFVRPGIYEDRLFGTQQPIHLIGAGRDHVRIFSRRRRTPYICNRFPVDVFPA